MDSASEIRKDTKNTALMLMALLAVVCVLAGTLMGMALQQDTDYKTKALESAQGRACVNADGRTGYCQTLSRYECGLLNMTEAGP